MLSRLRILRTTTSNIQSLKGMALILKLYYTVFIKYN